MAGIEAASRNRRWAGVARLAPVPGRRFTNPRDDHASVCSAISSASSTSIPRYRTVDSVSMAEPGFLMDRRRRGLRPALSGRDRFLRLQTVYR
jgi:hypothetical protein